MSPDSNNAHTAGQLRNTCIAVYGTSARTDKTRSFWIHAKKKKRKEERGAELVRGSSRCEQGEDGRCDQMCVQG